MHNTILDIKLFFAGVITFLIQVIDFKVFLSDNEVYLKSTSLIVLILFTIRRWYLMEKNNPNDTSIGRLHNYLKKSAKDNCSCNDKKQE